MKILSRFLNGNFELLEPYEGKLSSTVLRGGSGSNAADLLDNFKQILSGGSTGKISGR